MLARRTVLYMSTKILQTLWHINQQFWHNWSTLGLLLGLLFLSFSLSPSLVPRPLLLQGVASGVALSMGYALGVLAMVLWRYLELPELRGTVLRWSQWAAGASVSVVVVYFYSNATKWQNSVRSLMEMEPTDGVALVRVTLLAVLLWCTLVYLGTAMRWLYITAAVKVHAVVPRRVSYLVGGAFLTVFLVASINGVLVSKMIDITDKMYASIDQAIPSDIIPPTSSLRSGSTDSLVDWNDLGREGKYFVTGGPHVSKISTIIGEPARETIRVYVGLSAADSPEEQAALALAELKRTDAFARRKLIVATPTGTGWIDDGAVDSFEYLYGGDTAIVGVQYSYLSSPISLILDPDRARTSAQAVFSVIYKYWKELPRNERPDLLLFGLSLGSLGSENSADVYTLLSDPIDGALWAGPPFANSFWPKVLVGRNPDSPAFLPRLDDGQLVRVIGPSNSETQQFEPWGPLKIVYLLHPSDAISFFSFDLWYKAPDWLRSERGADVSPYLKWYPFVTMWQVGLDMLVTTDVPYGHGHNYAPADYVRAWVELDSAEDWSPDMITSITEVLGKGRLGR